MRHVVLPNAGLFYCIQEPYDFKSHSAMSPVYVRLYDLSNSCGSDMACMPNCVVSPTDAKKTKNKPTI